MTKHPGTCRHSGNLVLNNSRMLLMQKVMSLSMTVTKAIQAHTPIEIRFTSQHPVSVIEHPEALAPLSRITRFDAEALPETNRTSTWQDLPGSFGVDGCVVKVPLPEHLVWGIECAHIHAPHTLTQYATSRAAASRTPTCPAGCLSQKPSSITPTPVKPLNLKSRILVHASELQLKLHYEFPASRRSGSPVNPMALGRGLPAVRAEPLPLPGWPSRGQARE